MPPSEISPKQRFRQQARARRAAIDRRAERSAAIAARLMAIPLWAAAQVVSIYVSFRDEVETQLLIEAARASGKQVAIPLCLPDKTLAMISLLPGDELVPGSFGILEPARAAGTNERRVTASQALDIIVIPGLAFDRSCQRMGYGMGHYDRYLPLLRGDCVKVGLAYDAQMVDQLPTEPHDSPMDVVVTESELIRSSLFDGLAGDSPGNAIG
ncbi:putative 5-formyltetrahydrofolate cyclo-ligase [Anatilimnocola aggregata]|uniref:5-formyltetrahydrofolate cyclo-ligase n=1 Tax=Anatilimnocola aggregata TaxID=2528021 RepID=A0A517Y5G0_9BACT|nr:5-formyltetrahydrofolate cyclo-ligase [Anatilimnocola aggregata]QDU25362.1 putative 5-formyltetrahydrofolate cyclo-ligase [Anatilimnocola aggregata]